ncbi:MAG TPA: addiction module protein [Thermoanaerobaculia bacterium]|nr:addiction module protein [Thermoanaerobaculia bacterium]
MARSLPLPPPGFDDLSVEEKLDYLQSLWDRICAHPAEVPVPDWHRKVIQERLAAHRSDPGAVVPWEDARNELLASLNKRSSGG